jgi:hypothetical protein
LLVEALGNGVAHLCKAGVEGSIPFVSTHPADTAVTQVVRVRAWHEKQAGALPLDTFGVLVERECALRDTSAKFAG